MDDDLPQMDGTCDACEPDEPQPATKSCGICRFAFCTVHGEKHTRSTRHPLQPYSTPEPPSEPAPNQDAQNIDQALPGLLESRLEGADAAEIEHAGAKETQSPNEARKRDTVTVERLRCKEHSQEGSLYCKNDQKIVCVLCAVQGEHRGHEIITLHEAYLWQKVSLS